FGRLPMLFTDTTVCVTLTNTEAEALAQLLHRLCLADCRTHATSEAQARLMHDACDVIAKTLASLGHGPD
ncbi:MAG: hypothetical protein M3N23_08865, partial [Pseudomonadota bacterium]|nr:hypothetical protein [Pseudomonadota bacterium]